MDLHLSASAGLEHLRLAGQTAIPMGKIIADIRGAGRPKS